MKKHLHNLRFHITKKTHQGITIRIALYFFVGLISLAMMLYHAHKSQSAAQAQVNNLVTIQPTSSSQDPSFVSNTILVRLKKTSKNKVNSLNPVESPLEGIRNLKKKIQN